MFFLLCRYFLLISVLAVAIIAGIFRAVSRRPKAHNTMAFSCGKIVRAWSYARSIENNIESRIERVELDYERRLNHLQEPKPMDLVVAVGRMCSFFPTAQPSVIVSVLQNSGCEEFAVKQMLIRGYRMRKICSC